MSEKHIVTYTGKYSYQADISVHYKNLSSEKAMRWAVLLYNASLLLLLLDLSELSSISRRRAILAVSAVASEIQDNY